ncbi:MAG: hypothetical protein HYY57_01435, partial [Candidatus Omnitrophica bacterium]|nr:hypothetical protein [Candidatus Omnitrophota bacterium]
MTSTQQTAHSRQRGLLLIGLLTILSGPAQAAEETGVNPLLSAQATDVHPVTASLIAEHASIQPGGQTRIGVHFEMEEGWHIYAQDPGDAG